MKFFLFFLFSAADKIVTPHAEMLPRRRNANWALATKTPFHFPQKKHSSFFLFSCFLLLLLDAGLQKNAAEKQHKKTRGKTK